MKQQSKYTKESIMIKIANLCKSFGTHLVLDQLSIDIPDGSIFGLVGINGAGKSTLLRIMAGIYQANSGEVLYDGEAVYENEMVKKQIFLLPDDPYYSINTTGQKLVTLYRTFYSFDQKVFDGILHQFKLDINQPLRLFSKGMRRQMFIALAIACKPKYLLLDEAFDGLDPLARLAFKRSIIELVEKEHTTIIISSHSLRELEDICDSYGLLDHHQIISSGQIESEIDKIHKLQLAFNNEKDQIDFKGLDIVRFDRTGRLIRLIVRGNEQEIITKIEAMNPLFIDSIPIDFEELFMVEVESKGYLQ